MRGCQEYAEYQRALRLTQLTTAGLSLVRLLNLNILFKCVRVHVFKLQSQLGVIKRNFARNEMSTN